MRHVATRAATLKPGTVRTMYDLARVLKVSRDTAQRWRADGLEPEPDGSFSIEKAREFHNARQLRAGLRAPMLGAITSKERKLKADADMAELEFALAQGKVISREKVNKEWRRGVLAVKNRLLGLGRELAPHLTGRGPQEIKTLIDKRVFEILRLLAHKEYDPHGD